MTKRESYEELDEAVDRMLLHDTPPIVVDELDDLVRAAIRLREVPKTAFRARLKADLESHANFIAAGRTYCREIQKSNSLPLPGPIFSSMPATYPARGRNFVASFLAHVAMLALVITSGAWWVQQKTSGSQHTTTAFNFSGYVLTVAPDNRGSGGGGGGTHDKTPAPQGRLPKSSAQQLTPPVIVIQNENPVLPIEPTVVAPPISALKLPDLGDPASRVAGPPSNGPGGGGGIGNGIGGGVGPGTGPGVGPGIGGGFGDGIYRVGGTVSAPRILYAPDPDYSEEARKARYQGSVMLWLVVGPDGRTRDIKIARSLGLGLDQKAIDAVRTWKFEPALKDGRPVSVQINVEVNFRMY